MYQFTNTAGDVNPSMTMPEYKTIDGAKRAATRFYSKDARYIAIFCVTARCTVAVRLEGKWINK